MLDLTTKQIILPLLLGALVLANISCGVLAENEVFYGKTQPPPGNVLRYISGDEPESLDPQLTTTQPDARISMALYEGLVEYDAKSLEPQPAIAERWLSGQGIAAPALSLAHTGNAPLAALALDDGEFWGQRKALLGALTEAQVDALALAERVREFPIGRLLGWLQRWTYDLLSSKSIGRVRYNLDFEKTLTTLAAPLHAADIARYHRALVRQQRSVNHPLNPRLFIEQLLLSYAALMRGESPAAEHAG